MATPKQFRRRGRWSLIIGTLLAALTFGAVMAFASGSSVNTASVTFNTIGDVTCPLPVYNSTHFALEVGQTVTCTIDATGELVGSPTTVDVLIKHSTLGNETVTGTVSGNTITFTYTGRSDGCDTTNIGYDNGDGQQINAHAGFGFVDVSGNHLVCGTKANPSIDTDPGDGGLTGATLNDTATLADGSTSPAIGGTITFKLFAPGDDNCDGPALYTQEVTVDSGNGDYSTNPGYVALVKGTYNWTADYSGDDNNNKASSGCGEEALVVEAAAPTVLTEIHLSPDPEEEPVTVVGGDTPVDLGSTVHDQGTVTAPAVLGTPTGSVDFKFYKGDDCAAGEVTADPADVQVGSTSNVLLDSNGVAHPSADFGPLGAGSYYFTAHFKTGNENVWSDSDSTCEPLTVDKAQLTIVTQIHNAAHGNVGDATHVPLGSVVHDTATVTGAVPGFNPSGAITFTLDGNLVTQINPAELGFTATTVDSAPLGAGDYLYRASVAGDDNYIGDRSGPEPLTVDKGTLSIVTKIHDTSHAVVTFVPVNGIVHDTAHITGANNNFPVDTSKVSFTFYNTIDCTGR